MAAAVLTSKVALWNKLILVEMAQERAYQTIKAPMLKNWEEKYIEGKMGYRNSLTVRWIQS